jgi:hypothetical protein
MGTAPVVPALLEFRFCLFSVLRVVSVLSVLKLSTSRPTPCLGPNRLQCELPMPDRDDKSFWLTVARYSELAFVLPAATISGLLVGYLLDKWLHTSWLYLVGLLLGIAAGFVELVRTVTKSENNPKDGE